MLTNSCQEDDLQPEKLEINHSQILERAKEIVDDLNVNMSPDWQKQKSNGLEVSHSSDLVIDEQFHARWGVPYYGNKGEVVYDGHNLVIIPLILENERVDHILVGYDDDEEADFRIIHRNRTLTERTYNHTPLDSYVISLFDAFEQSILGVTGASTSDLTTSSDSDLTATISSYFCGDCDDSDGFTIPGTYEPYTTECEGKTWWCWRAVNESYDDGNDSGSGGSSGGGSSGTGSGSDPGGGDTGDGGPSDGGGGDSTGGGGGGEYTPPETTNPECLSSDPEGFDDPTEPDDPGCVDDDTDWDAWGECKLEYPSEFCDCKYLPPKDCSEWSYEQWQLKQLLPNLSAVEIGCFASNDHDVLTFLNNGGEETLAYAFSSLACEDSEYKFVRYKELIDILKDDPWALIEDCAQEEALNIQDYHYLYHLDLPNSTQTKLNNIGTGFQHQPIEDGNVAITNIDYYGVELTQLPDINANGQQDETAKEVFEAFRLQFGNLASGEKDNFDSNCSFAPNTNVWWNFEYYGMPSHPTINHDEQNWIDLSVDGTPLNTIFFIDAGADEDIPNLIADKGAIIISEYVSNSHYIGSTITTPLSGSQPFSGNRQWGYTINQNGNMEIYTKAIDVAHLTNPMRFASLIKDKCAMNDYYSLAKHTWQNLQNKINDWVEQPNYGGQANILVPKVALMPNIKVQEFLKQTNTITESQMICE